MARALKPAGAGRPAGESYTLGHARALPVAHSRLVARLRPGPGADPAGGHGRARPSRLPQLPPEPLGGLALLAAQPHLHPRPPGLLHAAGGLAGPLPPALDALLLPAGPAGLRQPRGGVP